MKTEMVIQESLTLLIFIIINTFIAMALGVYTQDQSFFDENRFELAFKMEMEGNK
jgi:hypothetical protein